MAESVATMLRGASTAARTITVKIKFKDLSLQSRSHTMERPIATGGAIGQVAAALLAGGRPRGGHPAARGERLGAEPGRGGPAVLRSRGRARRGQQSATAREQSWQDVTSAVDAIRDRFGRSRGGGRLHGHRRRRAGAGPARRAVGARHVATGTD